MNDLTTDSVMTEDELADAKLFDEIDQLQVRIRVEREARKHLVAKLAKQDIDIERLRVQLEAKMKQFRTVVTA